MSIYRADQLHRACKTVFDTPGAIQVWSVTDEMGGRYSEALTDLIRNLREDDPEYWQGLLAPAKALLWRLATAPLPLEWAPDRDELARVVVGEATSALHAVDSPTRGSLTRLITAARDLEGLRTTAASGLIGDSVRECGGAAVVFTSGKVATAAANWLASEEIPGQALTVAELLKSPVVEQAYLVGPPRFFGRRPIFAPRSLGITFITPHWTRDRAVPSSQFQGLTPTAIHPAPRQIPVGEPPTSTPAPTGDQLDVLEAPAPVWRPSGRQAGPDEVPARIVLLSGGYAIHLDTDGEHIRSLDITATVGQRVQQTPVARLSRGTVLVLREGTSESETLYTRALALMGKQSVAVEASQKRWKLSLEQRLLERGRSAVIMELTSRGATTAYRAPAWISRTLARPQSSSDFEVLLDYLGLGLDPFLSNANLVRRMRGRAVSEIREALEDAVERSDVVRFVRDGFMRLDLDQPGLPDMFAATVLAVSPHTEPVPRRDLRRPFRAEVPRWLE